MTIVGAMPVIGKNPVYINIRLNIWVIIVGAMPVLGKNPVYINIRLNIWVIIVGAIAPTFR